MKFQLDTINKIVTHESNLPLDEAEEVIPILEELLPNGLWLSFLLELEKINNWENPMVVKENYFRTGKEPFRPWLGESGVKGGVFNIELKN